MNGGCVNLLRAISVEHSVNHIDFLKIQKIVMQVTV